MRSKPKIILDEKALIIEIASKDEIEIAKQKLEEYFNSYKEISIDIISNMTIKDNILTINFENKEEKRVKI